MSESSQGIELTQRIGTRLSQQQLQYTRMLELTAPELDEAVERELEANPALETREQASEDGGRTYSWYARSQAPDVPDFSPADETESMLDSLVAQLSEQDLAPETAAVAEYIVGCLDNNGYLHRSLDEIRDDLAFIFGAEISPKEAEEALQAVKRLDPPGIGASNLQECLQLQLEAIPDSQVRNTALRIIKEAYPAFVKKHTHRIMSMLKIKSKEVQDALDLILSLNPKPGNLLGEDPLQKTNRIIPDFVVEIEDDDIIVSLNNRIPELCVSQSYEKEFANVERTPKGRVKKGSEDIVTYVNDARDFIKVLSQRQQTMMTVMSAIVKIQEQYFRSEDLYQLKPMMIKNVSELTGLDLSVISRVTSNKYVELPWGTFPLRFFFSDSLGEGEGSEAVTNRKIEDMITKLVKSEDKRHPYSDRKLMEELVATGLDISRRTIAKYRDRLGIPVARLRKEM